MTERYLFIHADGWCQYVDIEYRDLLAAVHELLECDHIEMASFADGAFIFVLDHVAKLDQKPLNSFATLLYNNKVDFIVGNALMGSYGLREGESDIVGLNKYVEKFLAIVCEKNGVFMKPSIKYKHK